MKRTSYILSMIAATSALLLSGCAKELSVADESPLTFGAEIAGIQQVKSGAEGAADAAQAEQKTVYLRAENGSNPISMTCKEYDLYEGDTAVTKAALQTSVSSFTAIGYKNSSEWFPSTSVTAGSSYPAYRWKSGENRTFFAYANMPSGVTPTFSENGVSLTDYVVPDTAAGELDAMLGRCVGSAGSSTGTAAIKFYHPFAAVEFLVGTLSGVTAISEISIEGVYAKGSTSLNATTAEVDGIMPFTWTTDGTKTVSQTISGDLPESGQPLCVPFVLIPQNLASANVTVKIQATTSEGAKTYSVTVNSGAWQAGKKYVYTLNYSNGPDPNYWVDLGAVTKDGKKLLFSRYNVASIDANGNATFDETLGGSGNTFTYEQAMSIKTAGGQVCRLPEKIEFISVLSDVNSSISINGNTISLTSKASELNEIDGSLLLFCDSSTGESRYHAVDGSCCVNMSNYSYNTRINDETDKNIFCRLVTIIDENIPLLENDFEVYYQRGGMYNSVTLASNIFTPEFETSGWATSVYLRPALVYANNYRYIEQLVSDEFRFKQDGGPWENNFYNGTGIWVDWDEEHTYVVENINFKKTVTIHHTNSMCFVKGTLITLSDGSKKPIEEITYNDELKVWNFDKGCYDTAKVFWLTKSGVKTEHYYKMTFSDGAVLNVLGPQFKKGHKIYNYTDRKFEGVKTFEVGKDVFTENGIVTLVSKEEMNEEVEFYCLMTKGHMNCFTDGVLTTLLQFNNIYSIDNDMKFVKDGRKKRPYKEFKAAGISREWYNGLRLGEQTDSLDVIRKYIDRCESQMAEKPVPSLWQRIKTWWKSIFG